MFRKIAQNAGTPPSDGAGEVPLRRVFWLTLVLSLIGVAVSLELTRIHLFVHTDPSYHSICAMSDGVNCETVAASPFSVFAGLPVSVWGIFGYLSMGAFAWSALRDRKRHPTWPLGILIVLAAFSVATSAVLGYISATRIDSLCLFCMATYVINGLVLALCLVGWRQAQASLKELIGRDAKAVLSRPLVSLLLALLSLAALGALHVFVPPYWATTGWSDLPMLPTGDDEQGHHWIGASNPRLTIVEFSDYQCPHCRAAHKDVRALAARHDDEIRLVHRHLPLDMACHPAITQPFHSRACLFAEAAECAALQDRFWDMNDALFASQETSTADDVDPIELGVRLGLDRSELESCLRSHATGDRIDSDIREAMARRLRGTPTFVVGDRLFVGGIPKEQLERLLEEAVVSDQASRPGDTSAFEG